MEPEIRRRMVAGLAAAMVTLMNGTAVAQDQKQGASGQDQQVWTACADARKNGQAGIDACTRILERHVAQMRGYALLHRGRAWTIKGDLDRALADLTEAIAADPNSPYAYEYRADIYRDNGRCDEAMADYDQVIRILPTRADMYVNRAVCWVRKGEHEQALTNFEMATRLDPSNANGVGALAWSGRGDLHAMKGKFARAVQDYDQAITLSPDELSNYKSRGLARFYLGDHRRAVDDLLRAADGSADPYAMLWLYLARGRAGSKTGGAELARLAGRLGSSDWPRPIVEAYLGRRSAEDAQAAAGSPDERCEAQFYIGQLQLTRGARVPAVKAILAAADICAKNVVEYRAAIEELKGIQLDPNNSKGAGALAWNLKGRAQLMQGDVDGAIAAYDEAVRLDPKLGAAYYNRGDALKQKGEYARAIQSYDRAIDLQFGDRSAYAGRGLMHFYLGNFPEAAADFSQVVQEQADAYSLLLLYLSLARAGGADAKDALTRAADRLTSKGWPYPVIELFLGRRSLEAVRAAATKPDQQCEIQYYAGQRHLLQGSQQSARVALQAAVDTCPKDFVEYRAAVAELKRLGR